MAPNPAPDDVSLALQHRFSVLESCPSISGLAHLKDPWSTPHPLHPQALAEARTTADIGDKGALWANLAPDLPGTARMVEAARLKARAPIALGDCFAAVTAAAHGYVLLTGEPRAGRDARRSVRGRRPSWQETLAAQSFSAVGSIRPEPEVLG